MTRDGRRLLLFFNIEPIRRVKGPAAAGLACGSGGGDICGGCAVERASRRVQAEYEWCKAGEGRVGGRRRSLLCVGTAVSGGISDSVVGG